MEKIDLTSLEQEIRAADAADAEDIANWIAAIVADYSDESPDRLSVGELCLKHGITQYELDNALNLTGTERRKPAKLPPTTKILAAAREYVEKSISAREAAFRHGVDYQNLLNHLKRTNQKRPRTRKVIPDEAIQAYQDRKPVAEILRIYKAKDGRPIYATELYNELERRGVEIWANGKWRRAHARHRAEKEKQG